MKNQASGIQSKITVTPQYIVLHPWEEIVDILMEYSCKDFNDISLTLSGNKIIFIPFSQGILDILSTLIGKKVAILRTDLKDKEYLVKKEV
jgi:glycopeptide antibiotics resistance protein